MIGVRYPDGGGLTAVQRERCERLRLEAAELFGAGIEPPQVAAAQRELVRIGVDHVAAAAVGGPAHWAGGRELAWFPTARFADLAQVRRHRPVLALDVRRDLEWAEGHLDGAVHIPLHELPARLHELPDGEVWVHCQSGYRSSVAASLLDAAGRRVVSIDDEFERAGAAGLALAGAPAGVAN